MSRPAQIILGYSLGFGLLASIVFPPLAPLGSVLVIIFLLLAFKPRRSPPSTTHGSARLGTWEDAKSAGLLASEGLILGRARLLAEGKHGEQLLRLPRFVHLATFAATGRGKGVGVVIPNLFTYPRSVVVTDKEGENFQTTSAYRGCAFGQPQYRLDPHQTCGPGGDRFNPLDCIDDQSITFLDECRSLANLIVFRQGTEHEPHWNDSAELIITAFIAFVCACSQRRDQRNLLLVHHLLSSPKTYAEAVATMQKVSTHHGVIADLGDKLSWYIEKELASVLSTVTRHLSFLASPAVARCVETSSFDPKELRSARGASVFICLATDQLATLAALNRLWVGTLLQAATRAMPSEHNPLLFILDEAAHLGRIDALEQAVTLKRGMGIRLWFIFQSLAQVKNCYGDAAGVFLDNIDTQQYFGLNHIETAEQISKRIGDATITDTSQSDTYTESDPKAMPFSPPQPGSVTRSHGVTHSQIARKVLFPDEILRLPEDVALVFHRNLPVLPLVLPKHYADPEFRHCLSHAQAEEPAKQALPHRKGRRMGERMRRAGVGAGLGLGVLGWMLAVQPATTRIPHPAAASPADLPKPPAPILASRTPRPAVPPLKEQAPPLSPPGEQLTELKEAVSRLQEQLRQRSRPPDAAMPPPRLHPGTAVSISKETSLFVQQSGVKPHLCWGDPKWCRDPLHCPLLLHRRSVRLSTPGMPGRFAR